jgi:hypothetical protein
VRLYEATQVELHGHYSIERLRSFHDYAEFKSSATRFTVVLLTTPWPCLAMLLLLETAPLQPPSLGTTENVVFWIRSDITMFIFTLSFIALCQKAVPELHIPRSKVVAVALVVTSVTQLWGFVMSITVGFPVPFNLVLESPVWLCSLLGSLSYTSWQFISNSATGLSSLKDWCKASMFIISLLFVYPLYNYAFINASSYGQTTLSLLLTVIKIAYKNVIAKCIRVQSDMKAEIVNLHVEISNALFVTFSMQNATSEVTLVVLVLVDFLHACSTLYEVHRAALVLEQLEQKIWQRGGHHGIHGLNAVDPPAHSILPSPITVSTTVPTLVHRASVILSRQGARDGLDSVLKLTKANNERNIPGQRVSWISHWARRLRVTQSPTNSIVVHAHEPSTSATASPLGVVVTNKTKPEAASSPLNTLEYEYTAKVLQLLFLTEFTVLTEFIEFIVPLIYGAFQVIWKWLHCIDFSFLTNDVTSAVHIGDDPPAQSRLLLAACHHPTRYARTHGDQGARVQSAGAVLAVSVELDATPAAAVLSACAAFIRTGHALEVSAGGTGAVGGVHRSGTARALW